MKKQKVILILFLAAVTALAIVSELRLRRDSFSGAASDRLAMPQFRSEDVRSVEISWRTQKTTLDFVPDGQYWAVKERDGAQAASAQVAELLEGLAKIAPLKELEISGEEDIRELNLETKEESASSSKNSEGILVVLRDGKGAELLRMMLGRGHTRLAADHIGNLAIQGYDGRYVRVWYPDAASRVFLISRVFEHCVPNPRQWLEPLFLSKPESPTYARFQRNGPDPETSGTVWFVTAAKDKFTLIYPQGELDMEAFTQKFSALATPFSVDLVANPPGDLKYNDVFQTVMADGFAYLIEFAKLDEASKEAGTDVYAGRMTVTFDPENVKRQIGEPDDAFEHRLKQLGSRAEYEKRTANGRVFLLKTGLNELLSEPPAKRIRVQTKPAGSAEKVETKSDSSEPKPATHEEK